MEKPPYVMGLLWDHFTPQVQAQVVKDLIAIKDQPKSRNLMAYYKSDDPAVETLIRSVGVERSQLAAPATLWVTYQTGSRDIEAPEHAKEVVHRDMRIKHANPDVLDTEEHSGFYLAPQGRNIAPTLDLNRPMPAHQPAGTDPAIIYLWGAVK